VAALPLIGGPHVTVFFPDSKINLKTVFRAIRNRYKIRKKNQENSWSWEIQFGTTFVIATSSDSPRILN
jgi:hypothetical protein